MPASPGSFEFFSVRYRFRAVDPFTFPSFLTGNTFRGALGSFLRSANSSAYEILFSGRGSRRVANPPRPFVLRCRELDGRTFLPGETFELQLNVFLSAPDMVLQSVTAALTAMSEAGFGPDRSRAQLLLPPETCRREILLSEYVAETNSLRVHFVTPTDLKSRIEGPEEPPTFATLLELGYRRLDNLRILYGPGPLSQSFTALRTAAAQVFRKNSNLQYLFVDRRGTRTGQTHSIGGLVGHVDFEGELAVFVPMLRALCHAGIGRHTVWGNGELQLEKLD